MRTSIAKQNFDARDAETHASWNLSKPKTVEWASLTAYLSHKHFVPCYYCGHNVRWLCERRDCGFTICNSFKCAKNHWLEHMEAKLGDVRISEVHWPKGGTNGNSI